jgi:hypothetical protein
MAGGELVRSSEPTEFRSRSSSRVWCFSTFPAGLRTDATKDVSTLSISACLVNEDLRLNKILPNRSRTRVVFGRDFGAKPDRRLTGAEGARSVAKEWPSGMRYLRELLESSGAAFVKCCRIVCQQRTRLVHGSRSYGQLWASATTSQSDSLRLRIPDRWVVGEKPTRPQLGCRYFP